ncbi:gliding motility-associated C-terminal domain-containing protein [Robiginitalea sediminis]|uniref:gliding motility-associated C-terminal domain-containing protein n=1 Tax=Robiginitalea sediminis TaxID=1982593 RepID=UPI0013033412|nr:gliding motility-associated C-terminal domain-containing protein [Robiginitalea sediminis]
MKKRLFIGLMVLGLPQVQVAQDGIGNHGDLKFHGMGAIGLHADLWNSGTFSSPEGLVGFYQDSVGLKLYGSVPPEWFDLEVAAANGVDCYQPIRVANNVNFIEGDLRNRQSGNYAALIFDRDAFQTGASTTSKVDGYAAFQYKDAFVLPIGNEERFRPLGVESQAVNGLVTGGYYADDPNESAMTQGGGNSRRNRYSASPEEYWTLDGDLPTRVTLSWGGASEIRALVTDLSELRVLGLNPRTRTWEDLGRTSLEGDLSAGTIRTDWITPTDYMRFALGTANAEDLPEDLENENYYISPNGDGKNESLILPMALDNPNNTLSIYNRSGVLVYQEKFYTGGFMGKSNKAGDLEPNLALKRGIYFYILTLHETGKKHQGYFYLRQ